MKPAPFLYVAPRDEEELIDCLAEYGGDARLLAGGQSLVPMMNFRVATPAVLVDINHIGSLSFIKSDTDRIEIGALARHAMLEDKTDLCRRLPLISEAIRQLAHRAVRNRGTMGGSMALAYPNAELPLLFITLGASLRLKSKRSRREVLAVDFIAGPLETALADGEFIQSSYIDAPAPSAGTAFIEVARRHGDFALAAAAAVVDLSSRGCIRDIKLGSSGGQGRPIRLVHAERALLNETPECHRMDEAVRAAVSDLEVEDEPRFPAGYRRLVLTTVLQRALQIAAQRADRNHAH